jgi:hypothetical protein
MGRPAGALHFAYVASTFYFITFPQPQHRPTFSEISSARALDSSS